MRYHAAQIASRLHNDELFDPRIDDGNGNPRKCAETHRNDGNVLFIDIFLIEYPVETIQKKGDGSKSRRPEIKLCFECFPSFEVPFPLKGIIGGDQKDAILALDHLNDFFSRFDSHAQQCGREWTIS